MQAPRGSLFFTLLFFCIFTSVSEARQIRFALSYSADNNYQVGNLGSKFYSQFYGLDMNYLSLDTKRTSSTSSQSASNSSLRFNGYWGFGFNYSKLASEIKTRGATDLVSPNKFGADFYNGSFILGLEYSSFAIEIPMSASLMKENGSFNSGDQKYGYTYGANLYYRPASRLQIGIGFEKYNFDSGKDVSTGESGSLTTPITFTNIKLIISYAFDLGPSEQENWGY